MMGAAGRLRTISAGLGAADLRSVHVTTIVSFRVTFATPLEKLSVCRSYCNLQFRPSV